MGEGLCLILFLAGSAFAPAFLAHVITFLWCILRWSLFRPCGKVRTWPNQSVVWSVDALLRLSCSLPAASAKLFSGIIHVFPGHYKSLSSSACRMFTGCWPEPTARK